MSDETNKIVVPTFDEQAYRAELMSAGLSETTAAEVAANMARIKREGGSNVQAQAKAEPLRAKARTAKPKPSNAGAGALQGELLGTPPQPKQKKASGEKPVVYDYRSTELPAHVRELIETHLAIENEEAKSAGTLGFMTRSLAIATLPHRRVDDFRFVRKNGDFTLTMMTAHPEGLPYGTLPRILLAWVCTEVAQKRERVLHLGDTLADYLAELGLYRTGGKRGDITRLKFAMTTLFSSVISCHYVGKENWMLQNVMLADGVDWWSPQDRAEAGEWRSRVQLTDRFFTECVEHKFPYDMRAIRVLRSSPLALDIYLWLTLRMSYLRKRTLIPWEGLAGQFGAGYAHNEQGLRDFKRAFLRELKNVLIVYPQARVSEGDRGKNLVLYPSPTHVPSLDLSGPSQPPLPFSP